MASALYPSYKTSLLDGTAPDLDTGTIKCDLIDTGTYTYSTAHDFYDDVTGTVGSSGTLDSITVNTPSAGVFDAADEVFPTVTGNSIEALIIWEDTAGASSTDPLICYIDGFTAVTPNGGNITVTWDSGANRIFAI